MAVAVALQTAYAITEKGDMFTWGKLSVVAKNIDENKYVFVSAFEGNMGAIDQEGLVYTWGEGYFGSLGHGNQMDKEAPACIDKILFGNLKAVMIACGGYHTIVLTEDYRMWTFGLGQNGRLGHGDTESSFVPKLVLAEELMGNVVMVAAGGAFSIAVVADGHVYTWGDGWKGTIGQGYDDDKLEALVPTRLDESIFAGSRVFLVSAGCAHSVATTTDGKLYVWGHGHFGRLGLGDQVNKYTPTLLGNEYFNGSCVLKGICGQANTFVITEDGSLWSFGYGNTGNLGHGYYQCSYKPRRIDPIHFGGSGISHVSGGKYITMAVTNEGYLYTWGKGRNPIPRKNEQEIYTGLGHEHTTDCTFPTLISSAQIQSNRVGIYHDLCPMKTLAFVMGTHTRLGKGELQQISCLPEIIRVIIELCKTVPANDTQKLEGIMLLVRGCLKS